MRSTRSPTSCSSFERVSVTFRCFGPGRVRCDKGQRHVRLLRARKLDLRLFRRFLQPLQCLPVTAQINAVLALELVAEPVNDLLVEVVTTEMRVTVRGIDLEHAFGDVEDRDVVRATTKVVDGNPLVLFLVNTVGERACRRLVDDAQHVQPRDPARIFRRLPLRVVEVRRYGDNRFVHFVTEIGFGVGLELLQDHAADLLRAICLAAEHHLHIAIARRADLVGDQLDIALHGRVVELTPDKALHRGNRILRVHHRLPLGELPDEPLATRRHRNHGGRQPAAFGVGNHGGFAALHHRHHRVRRAQVNTNRSCHITLLIIQLSVRFR